MIFADLDSNQLMGGGGVGLAMGAALMYFFRINKESRAYIREAVGKNEKVDVHLPNQPIQIKAQVSYAEKEPTDKQFAKIDNDIKSVQTHFDNKFEEARRETGERLDAMTTDAVDGRRRLHDKFDKLKDEVAEVRKDMSDIPGETINLLLKTKGLKL